LGTRATGALARAGSGATSVDGAEVDGADVDAADVDAAAVVSRDGVPDVATAIGGSVGAALGGAGVSASSPVCNGS
jgi:hypothetical protein